MKLFFKETVWREVRVKLSQEQEKVVADFIQNGEISNVDELYYHLNDIDVEPYQNDFELETAEPMFPVDNDNQPTIEAYFKNSKKGQPDVTN